MSQDARFVLPGKPHGISAVTMRRRGKLVTVRVEEMVPKKTRETKERKR